MKKNLFVVIFAIVLLTFCSIAAFASGDASDNAASSENTVVVDFPETATDWISSAISCKSFSDKDVPDELVEEILSAGIKSPSAINTQPWKFILVKNEELKTTLVKNAPVVVIVAVPTEDYTAGGDSQFAAGVAAESMYLYAQAAGLGAHMYTAPCAMTINVSAESQASYGIPEGYEAAVVLAFGYYTDYSDAVSGASVRNEYDSFVTVLE